jgi:ABC-type tungstate transport system permease subunit
MFTATVRIVQCNENIIIQDWSDVDGIRKSLQEHMRKELENDLNFLSNGSHSYIVEFEILHHGSNEPISLEEDDEEPFEF